MREVDTYSADAELALYREYREIVHRYRFAVETERRFYLANDVDLKVRASDAGDIFFEVTLHDAWVWDIHRSSRFIRGARIVTFKDVNVEELNGPDTDRG
ncbi:MAG: DUF2469 family protein [Actinomycetaceae bacterium]|nr:DUF2469 family protein [Actinomycetaceae bacterium]